MHSTCPETEMISVTSYREQQKKAFRPTQSSHDRSKRRNEQQQKQLDYRLQTTLNEHAVLRHTSSDNYSYSVIGKKCYAYNVEHSKLSTNHFSIWHKSTYCTMTQIPKQRTTNTRANLTLNCLVPKSHVAQSCYSVIGDKQFLSMEQKSTLCNFVLPGPIVTKLGMVGMVDYVGDPYPYANFS